MSITELTSKNNTKVVRTGSTIPAYFLGRTRDAYVEALAAARIPDPVFARAA